MWSDLYSLSNLVKSPLSSGRVNSLCLLASFALQNQVEQNLLISRVLVELFSALLILPRIYLLVL